MMVTQENIYKQLTSTETMISNLEYDLTKERMKRDMLMDTALKLISKNKWYKSLKDLEQFNGREVQSLLKIYEDGSYQPQTTSRKISPCYIEVLRSLGVAGVINIEFSNGEKDLESDIHTILLNNTEKEN